MNPIFQKNRIFTYNVNATGAGGLIPVAAVVGDGLLAVIPAGYMLEILYNLTGDPMIKGEMDHMDNNCTDIQQFLIGGNMQTTMQPLLEAKNEW